MDDYKLSEESATAQYDLILSYYRLKPERAMSQVQSNMFRADLTDSIRRGEIEVDIGENGISIKQNLVRTYKKIPSTIEYREVGGKAKQIAMKLGGDSNEYDKMLVFVGYLTGIDKTLLPELLSVDNRNMERLSTLLFLA